MRKILVVASVLFLLFLSSAENSFACSCVSEDKRSSLNQRVREAYKNSTAVFSAKILIITEQPEAGNVKVKIRLVKSWKGKIFKTLTITTGLGGGDCGYHFEAGKVYLIYAYQDENNKLNTNICTRTTGIVSNKEVTILNKLQQKKFKPFPKLPERPHVR